MLYLKKNKHLEIILQLCTKNISHTIYSFWDKECDRLKLIIMGHFLPFYPSPLKPEKLEFWKNEKKLLEISSFYICVPKVTIIWGPPPEIHSGTDRIFCHFRLLFALLPPLTTRKIKILKKWKKHLEISSFYTCVPQTTIIWSATKFLLFWTIFCPFTLLITQKIKILKKPKTRLEISSFYTSVP